MINTFESSQHQKVETLPEIEFTFSPSDTEKEIVKDVLLKFRLSKDERDKNFQYFDGRNLVEYINDSVRRFVTNIDEREGIEDWQARVHDQFTNNKVIAILGRMVGTLSIANFEPRGTENMVKVGVLNDLFEFSEDVDDYEENMIHILLEAIVKGTAVVYEGVRTTEKTYRDTQGVGDDITVTERKESKTEVYTQLVPLEEFYPSSVRVRRMGDMPYCFWRTEIPYSQFMAEWNTYEKHKFVQPFAQEVGDENLPFYQDIYQNQSSEGNVEIIRYYNQEKDQYIILANGVWLNPIQGELISPNIFAHKSLPFWAIKFHVTGDWFYGRSLPDKLGSMQDVLNVLSNMLLDQSFLTIFPPILTNGSDDIEDDYLRPGRRTPVDTQGLPLSGAFMKLDLGTPSGWHQFILNYTRSVMEESSMDKVSQGVAGQGDRTTAAEIRTAAEGVASILGLFGKLVNYGLKKRAVLRAQNILQYWTNPETPYIKGILGEDGDEVLNKAFSTFEFANTTLSDGRRGVKIVELYQNLEQLPAMEDTQARGIVEEQFAGRPVEILTITSDYIRNVNFDVRVTLNPDAERSKELKEAIQLKKAEVYLSMFPEMVDKDELFAQTTEVFGDDPIKMKKRQEEQEQMAQDPEQVAGMDTGATENLLRSTGFDQGDKMLSDLQQ